MSIPVSIPLVLSWSQENAFSVLALAGDIDTESASPLREAIIDWLEAAKAGTKRGQLVIDLDGVTHFDSTGMGVLLGALKRFRANEFELVLVLSKERILKIFRITGMEKIFPIFPNVADIVW